MKFLLLFFFFSNLGSSVGPEEKSNHRFLYFMDPMAVLLAVFGMVPF